MHYTWTYRALQKNKATGWLAALVRVTNLKFWILRLRVKMRVFVGLVKKCLQYGHSFRLAGVWLMCKNLRFGCAVNPFYSSRAWKQHWKFMIFNHPNHLRETSTHLVFCLLEVSVPECFWQRNGHRLQQGDIITPCTAVCPSVLFLYAFWFFLWSMDIGLHFNNGNMFRNVSAILVRDVNTPPHPPSPLMNIRQHVGAHVQHVSNSNMFRNVNALFVRNVYTPHHPPHTPPDENQILYPHFGNLDVKKIRALPRDPKWHISKLITSQGRRISRMPKTTIDQKVSTCTGNPRSPCINVANHRFSMAVPSRTAFTQHWNQGTRGVELSLQGFK